MESITLEKLKDVRVSRGWTQELLSQASGLSRRTIQRLEAGAPASPETVKSLLSTLELTSIADLAEHETKTNDSKREYLYFSSPSSAKNESKQAALQYICGFIVALWALSQLPEALHTTSIFPEILLSTVFPFLNDHTIVLFIALMGLFFPNLLFSNENNHANLLIKRKPTLRIVFPTLKGMLDGFYVEERNFFVGLTRDSKNLISLRDPFDIQKGVAFVGGGTEAPFIAQQSLFPFICSEFGGLVLLTKTDTPKMNFLSNAPKWLKKEGNIVFMSEQKAAKQTPQWWYDAFINRKIVVVRCDEEATLAHQDILSNFFKGIKIECYSQETPQLFPFLCLNEKHIENFELFGKEFELSNALTGLKVVLVAQNIERISRDKTGLNFVNQFDHVHLLKSKNNDETKNILMNITAENEKVKNYDIASLKQFSSIYRHRNRSNQESTFFGVRLFYLFESTPQSKETIDNFKTTISKDE